MPVFSYELYIQTSCSLRVWQTPTKIGFKGVRQYPLFHALSKKCQPKLSRDNEGAQRRASQEQWRMSWAWVKQHLSQKDGPKGKAKLHKNRQPKRSEDNSFVLKLARRANKMSQK